MQKTVLLKLAILSILLGGCPARSQKAKPTSKPVASAVEVKRYDAKTFYETVSMFGASFSHDEQRLLVSSDATGVYNAQVIPTDGSAATLLTRSTKDTIRAVSYFPRDDRILYTADQGGNELNHLFVRELDGKVRDITPGKKLKAMFVDWSGDKSHFWVLTNERNERFFDLYRYATDGYKRKRVFTNDAGWQISDVSRDSRWVALVKVHNNIHSDVFVWDTTKPTQIPRRVSPKVAVRHNVLTFTPDSKQLYYATNEHGEFHEAWAVDLESLARQRVIKADWDVWFVYFSETGRYRVVGLNQDARTVVTVLDTKSKKLVTFPKLPAADITGVSFSRSEKKIAFYVSDDTSPRNLHLLDLQSGKHSQLSNNLNRAVARDDLVRAQVVRYRSFDGRKIPALLYRPHNASAKAPTAALVWVHGGPGGQTRHGYFPLLQYLVNHGYAVLGVNNRGSSGYGKTFYHLDDRKHGEDDLKDCIWGRRYLESLPWVDRERIGIIGGSYGGYMVVAALAFSPETFDVGIDIFGVTNWLRTLKSIPPYWESFKKYLYGEMGDPKVDEARLRRISPLFHAEKIQRPLLVVQGANDARVLKAESDEIVGAVKKNNVPVQYVVFDDEGHGFRKRKNRITAAEAYVKFLQTHLR